MELGDLFSGCKWTDLILHLVRAEGVTGVVALRHGGYTLSHGCRNPGPRDLPDGGWACAGEYRCLFMTHGLESSCVDILGPY
jgi:hypothetical protein